MMKKPKTFFTVLSLMITLGLFGVLYWRLPGLDRVLSWVIAASITAFLLCGYDKAVAGRNWTRVPEGILLFSTFMGGTLGMLAGMALFRHKTVKGSFRIKFWLVIIAQIGLLLVYIFWLKPKI